MTTLTVDLVSKNFLHQDAVTGIVYDYNDLVSATEYFKKLLIDTGAQPGMKIGVGYNHVDLNYFAAIFAAGSLGLELIVLEMTEDAPLRNPKTEMFFPLDIFVQGKFVPQLRCEYFRKNSITYISDAEWLGQSTIPTRVQANSNDIVLQCTSSGTTDTPKKLVHTHAFITAVAKRNSELFKFSGKVLHLRTLHHGSSLNVFFLPSLLSDQATGHYYLNSSNIAGAFEDTLARYCYTQDINHVQIPFSGQLTRFIKSSYDQGLKFKNLTVYTLQYIDPDLQKYVDCCGQIKIISIFGCNETTGPLLINTMIPGVKNFVMKQFEAVDNFYHLSLNHQQQLVAKLPIYNKNVTLQDLFNIQGNNYYHIGRSDLIRINDVVLDFFWLTELCDECKINGQLIIDRDLSKIYLAVWDDSDQNHITGILNQHIHNRYGNQVSIDSTTRLDKKKFYYGIKLDHELIRQVFRSHSL